jgi:hypothetical protein
MSKLIDWRCAVCGDVIKDGDGYITVNLEDALRYESVSSPRQTSNSVAGTFNEPVAEQLVIWQALHPQCDPEPEVLAYSLEIEDVRTVSALLDRSAHVKGKSWSRSTDFAEFVERMK